MRIKMTNAVLSILLQLSETLYTAHVTSCRMCQWGGNQRTGEQSTNIFNRVSRTCGRSKQMMAFLYTGEASAAKDACGEHGADIVFLIDSSSSIWKPDFDRQIQFIKDVSEQFELGNKPNQTRIGVMSFCNNYHLEFHLWQNNRPDLLSGALQRIRHRLGRKTNTGAALNFMSKHMFTHRYGSRKSAAHIAVVITDGKSQKRKQTLAAALKARSAGIQIFAIGVGDGVDYRELEEIASKPKSKYMFAVNDFKALSSMKHILANRSCKALPEGGDRFALTTTERPSPTLPSVPLYPPYREIERGHFEGEAARSRPPIQADIDPGLNVTNCGGKPADIYFALDASNSIWPEDFKRQLKFVRDLISLFDVAPVKTRVGLITFSDVVKPIFDFNTKQEKNHLYSKMENVSFMSGRTQTSEAIKFIREQGFSRDVSRREVAHIIFLFTDGISKNPRDTAREAELAKREGIYLFSIGIGMSVEKTELEDIASDPNDDFMFLVSNFSVLNTIKNILAIKTCAIQPNDFLVEAEKFTCDMKGPTDLMFVYDSAQLGIHKTRKITKFVYDVTSALNTGDTRLKMGRLMENCLTGADTFLTAQQPALDFDEIYFPDLRRLIRKLAAVGFSESYGARRNAKKVAVLFLDDDIENIKQAANEITRLRETHTLVVTIGNTDIHTAAKFASRPANDYMVHIPSYKYLMTAKHTLMQKICKVLGM